MIEDSMKELIEEDPPVCPKCGGKLLIEGIERERTKLGSWNGLFKLTLLCPECGSEWITEIAYDVRRVSKIQKLLSRLPEDLRTDPNLYHEDFCIEVGKFKICESYRLFRIYEEGKLILVTPDIEAVRIILEQGISGLRLG